MEPPKKRHCPDDPSVLEELTNFWLFDSLENKSEEQIEIDQVQKTVMRDYSFAYDKLGDLKDGIFIPSIRKYIDAMKTLVENQSKFIFKKHFLHLLKETVELIASASSLELLKTHFFNLIDELERMVISGSKPIKMTASAADKLKKKVEKINSFLFDMIKQIKHYESQDFDILDLDRKNPFTELPKLRKAVVKCWTIRERLIGNSDITMQHRHYDYTYEHSENPKLNEIVTKFYREILAKIQINDACRQRKKAQFDMFNICDLKKYIENAHIDINDEDVLKIFTTLWREHSTRYHADYERSMTYYQITEKLRSEMPEESEELQEKFKENDKEHLKNIEQRDKLNDEAQAKALEHAGTSSTAKQSIDWKEFEQSNSGSSDEESSEEDEEEITAEIDGWLKDD